MTPTKFNQAFQTGSITKSLSGLILLALLINSQAMALPEDKLEKVYIVSERSSYNYKTGIKIFEGNVKVDQGTTHLTADKLVTKDNIKHKIQEAIAYGFTKQAHYWTIPKEGDAVMHAYAKIIKYYPTTANVVLEKDAVVTQGENSFQGQVILYNMNDQTVTVPASKNARAVLVYNPDN
ncbi:lipopolysaccharide transport periplasmic protein LptA [Aquicella lusitana]|jgi:lipopolysaccharide transport periplasmic protein LptA|nr:lipopolysaccharide transport periplasmic protein LptA [Aquicella lusitana]